MDYIMTKDTVFPCSVVGFFASYIFSYVLILFQVQSYNIGRERYTLLKATVVLELWKVEVKWYSFGMLVE